MILLISILFSAACVAASAKRLWFVIEATPLDPGALSSSLRPLAKDSSSALAGLGDAVGALPGADWETSLVHALSQAPEARVAVLGEALTELDFRMRRWVRVPRVCASLASTFGFLLATVALRVGLSDLETRPDPGGLYAINAAVFDAVDVAAVGLVGTAFCIALQLRARVVRADRTAGAERLIQLLDATADRDAPFGPAHEP